MGCGFILVGWLVDPLFGLAPGLGILMLMLAAFFANFWRDPDRPIPRDEGIIVSPADGHVMFAKRERATGRRPSSEEMEGAEEDNRDKSPGKGGARGRGRKHDRERLGKQTDGGITDNVIGQSK